MLLKYALEQEKDWDEGVHLLLYAVRGSQHESLGYSPFQLIFGHEVRGPLKLLKETWIDCDSPVPLLSYVKQFKEKLKVACVMASENLAVAKSKMKVKNDGHSV